MSALEERLWQWLPARPDRRRVAIPAVAAAALGTTPECVAAALAAMETRGHAVRDRPTGRRAGHWHRGAPLPRPGAAPRAQEQLW